MIFENLEYINSASDILCFIGEKGCARALLLNVRVRQVKSKRLSEEEFPFGDERKPKKAKNGTLRASGPLSVPLVKKG